MENKIEYNNNIYLIGKNTELIKKLLNLDSFCIITTDEIKDNKQIDTSFDTILKNIEKIRRNATYGSSTKFSYTIIYSLNEVNEEKENLEKLFKLLVSKLKNNYYFQPFIIFLNKDYNDKLNLENFLKISEFLKGFDNRNISCYISPNYSNENSIKEIRDKIYRIFSYFYSLGDEFKLKDKNYKIYIPPRESLNPINILVIGKTQQGKSTFINTLLKEKRAKEGKGKSETKEQITYHLDKLPLIINDIEGFIGEETINKVIEKIDYMQKKLEENELHLVVYVISYESESFFNENEYLIFKQLTKKLDNTQFLFVCTKSKEDDENNIIEEIRESFFQMIQKGFHEKEEEKNNIINVLNYLYFAVKKDISYDEIFKDKNDKTSIEKYNNMDFFDKLELKFKGKSDTEKNCEMIETILEKDKSLLFVNLIEDCYHKKVFGMDLVSKQIRNVFSYIKKENINFIDRNKIQYEEKIKELEKEIQKLIKEKDNYINILLEPEPDLNEIKRYNMHNTLRLLKETKEELTCMENKYENIKNLMENLISFLNENKIFTARQYAEKVKDQIIEEAKKDVSKHNIYAIISGMFPLVDLILQHLIKKDARKKISNRFKDDLIEFEGGEIKFSGNEEKSKKKIKENTSNKIGNILKNVFKEVAMFIGISLKTFYFPLGSIGIAIGMLAGGKLIEGDINGLLEFYGKRLIYRFLINLSFNSIEKNLIDNFETLNKQ